MSGSHRPERATRLWLRCHTEAVTHLTSHESLSRVTSRHVTTYYKHRIWNKRNDASNLQSLWRKTNMRSCLLFPYTRSPCPRVLCLGPVTQCDTAALTGSLVTGNVMTQPVTITSRYNTFKKWIIIGGWLTFVTFESFTIFNLTLAFLNYPDFKDQDHVYVIKLSIILSFLSLSSLFSQPLSELRLSALNWP